MVSGILIKSLREYSIGSFSKIRGPTNSSRVNIHDTLGQLHQSRPQAPCSFPPLFLRTREEKKRESRIELQFLPPVSYLLNA